jgi:hypothetical protein
MVGYAATARVTLIGLVTAGCLGGCSDYVDRKETIAFSAGNAVQTNIVTHVTDPWPPYARNKDIAVSGQRMQRAVENYRCGKVTISDDDSSASAPAEAGKGVC